MINDVSEDDIDIKKKALGSQFKSFIKTNSNDYLTRLKEELMKGFKEYYAEIQKKIGDELKKQEDQQNDYHKKIDEQSDKSRSIIENYKIRKYAYLKAREQYNDHKVKVLGFMLLYTNMQKEQQQRKTSSVIEKLFEMKRKKKLLNILKRQTIFAKTQEFQEKKQKREDKLMDQFIGDLAQRKREMNRLINEAKEKLKHEQRKKLQVKLALDQMILKGISNLNAEAIKLAQNSLNGNKIFIYYYIIFLYYIIIRILCS